METSIDKDSLVLINWTVFNENFYSLELLQIESTLSTVRKTRLLPEQCKLNISVAVFTCLDPLNVDIRVFHKLSTIQKCQCCQLCFRCAIIN